MIMICGVLKQIKLYIHTTKVFLTRAVKPKIHRLWNIVFMSSKIRFVRRFALVLAGLLCDTSINTQHQPFPVTKVEILGMSKMCFR